MKARLFGKNDDGFNGAYDFLMDFCCSILIELRESILERNFADSIKLLQAHFNVDMPKLLNLTFELQHLRKTSKNDEDMSYVRKNSYNTNALANSLKNRVLSTYNTVKANVPQSSSSYTDNNKQKEPLEEKRSFFPSFRSSLDGVSPTQGRVSKLLVLIHHVVLTQFLEEWRGKYKNNFCQANSPYWGKWMVKFKSQRKQHISKIRKLRG